MTFEVLARKVAGEFRKDMKNEGFTSFDEMKRCYCWEWADIKDEVEYIISEIAKAAGNADIWMADDHTFIQNGCDDIAWKDFKKLLMANLKAEEDYEEE